MKRREALVITASIMGAAIIGSEFLLSGCTNERKIPDLFSDLDISVLDEVGEVILPQTQLSPGAKDAKIGLFMKSIVTDCYNLKEQKIFKNGIAVLNQMALDAYSKNFLDLEQTQKFDLLVKLDKDTRDGSNENKDHFFIMMKQLTIWGYFTSEPGATKALKYNQIPGKFIGCIPYKEGDKAWA